MAADAPLFPGSQAGRAAETGAPLADRMRPQNLDEVVGQQHLAAPGAPLRALIEAGTLPSLILWGPPGTGKTTLARLVAAAQPGGAAFAALSAVMAGLKEVRAILDEARRGRRAGLRTVFFLDEIHRFNRAQQDALLPHVEAGTVTLIGATTENPSFEVIGPLLSRCRVFTLRPLCEADIEVLLRRAAADTRRGLGAKIAIGDDAFAAMARLAGGDARRALGILETAAAAQHARGQSAPLDARAVGQAAGARAPLYDRDREEHYNTISAFIKSLRASDPDAALYYMARMLEAGEDPLFVCRRLAIFAAEDVGNAEPAGLPLALSAWQAVERMGLPEGRIPLAQAVTFLACAPKSNRALVALQRASDAARETAAAAIPMHLRNAPTPLLKAEGYGAGYQYPHDAPDGFVPTRNLPDAVGGAPFYEPTGRGAEGAIAARLAEWRRRLDSLPDPH